MKRPSILESNRKMNESGFSSSIFRPNARITLDAMMTLVWRLCRSVGALRAIKALDPWTRMNITWEKFWKSLIATISLLSPCHCRLWNLGSPLCAPHSTLYIARSSTCHSTFFTPRLSLRAVRSAPYSPYPHSALGALHFTSHSAPDVQVLHRTPHPTLRAWHFTPCAPGYRRPLYTHPLHTLCARSTQQSPCPPLRTPHSTFPTPYPHSTPPSLLYAPQSNVLYITLALCTCFTLSVTFYTWHPSLFVKGRVQIGNFGVTDDGHGWISRRHVNFIILSTAHHEVIGRRNSSDAEAKPCVFTGMVAPRVTTLWFHEKLCSKSPCQCWSIGTAKHWCCDAPALRNCSWRLPNAL